MSANHPAGPGPYRTGRLHLLSGCLGPVPTARARINRQQRTITQHDYSGALGLRRG